MGPFLRLLDSSDELEMLAARPGYSKDIGRGYRDLRRRTMRGYLLDLEAEFEQLYREASAMAIRDPALALLVADMSRAFGRLGGRCDSDCGSKAFSRCQAGLAEGVGLADWRAC